jgi:hypothetical protein
MVFKGTDIYGERLSGTFIFSSETLTPFVFDGIGPNNTQQYCQERILYRWIAACDHALQVCTLIDSDFDRFEYIAANMIKACHGEVYPANSITCNTEGTTTGKGWIFEALYCPEQHLLLRSKILHLY